MSLYQRWAKGRRRHLPRQTTQLPPRVFSNSCRRSSIAMPKRSGGTRSEVLTTAMNDLDQGNYTQAVSNLRSFDSAVQSAADPSDLHCELGRALNLDRGRARPRRPERHRRNQLQCRRLPAWPRPRPPDPQADDPANNQQISGAYDHALPASFTGTARFSVGDYSRAETDPSGRVVAGNVRRAGREWARQMRPPPVPAFTACGNPDTAAGAGRPLFNLGDDGRVAHNRRLQRLDLGAGQAISTFDQEPSPSVSGNRHESATPDPEGQQYRATSSLLCLASLQVARAVEAIGNLRRQPLAISNVDGSIIFAPDDGI